MADAMRPGTEDFGRRLFRLGQNWRRHVDMAMQQFGLTDATWRPLFYLGRFGDGMRQKDLAAVLDIEGPSLVRLLDALERQELVERCGEAEDRRTKTLRMTAAGRAMYRKLDVVYRRISNQLLHDVSDADIQACTRAFGQIEAAMAGLTPPKAGREH